MTTKVVPGMLVATETAADVAGEAAGRMGRVLRKALGERSRVCIALSGGTTPRAAYAALARAEDVDWSRVHVFFVDERAVPPTSDRSNFRMVKEALLDPAKIPPANVVRMEADSSDIDDAARRYEAEIKKRVAPVDGTPAFDLTVFGVGADGHTASLFPGEPTISVHDRYAIPVPARGEREARMTLTVPVLEHSRSAIVIAVGAEKRDALAHAWQAKGDVSTTPARIVRGIRGGLVWIIDRAAGGLA